MRFLFALILIKFSNILFGQNQVIISSQSPGVEIVDLNYWKEEISIYTFKRTNFHKDSIYEIHSDDQQLLTKLFFDMSNDEWLIQNYFDGQMVKILSMQKSFDVFEQKKEAIFYPSGAKYTEIDWQKGYNKELQILIHYHENGQIKRQCGWVVGSLIGACIEYYENGNIKSIVNYNTSVPLDNKANQKDGQSVFFKENGDIEKMEFYEDGELIKK